MNLRVDLILEQEQRSGSILSAKSLLRISSIVLPVVLFGFVFMFFFNISRMERELTDLQNKLEVMKPKQETSLELLAKFSVNAEVQKELDGIKSSRLDLHSQLTGLMSIVPTNMQIRSFTVNAKNSIENDRRTMREYTMLISGRAINRNAESSVKAFVEKLQDEGQHFGAISNIVWDGKADPAPAASRTDRIFDLQARYFDRAIK